MKLSIWQQFSSNHSSSYTVVGQFESAQSASKAAREIKSILNDIKQWYVNHDKAHPTTRETPTPVEDAYGEQYGFDWLETIDWVTYRFDENVKTYDRLVFVSTRGVDTWQTGHQFASLLDAMGANVARSVFDGVHPEKDHDVFMSFRVEIQARAQTAQRAASLVKQLNSVFVQFDTMRQGQHYIPWLVHHPDLEDRRNEISFMWKLLKARLFNDWHEFRTCQADLKLYDAQAFHNDRDVTIVDVYPHNIPITLQSLTAYLREKNCTDIVYHIRQLPEGNT